MKKVISLLFGIIGLVLMASSFSLSQDREVEIYCDDDYPPYSYMENGMATGIYTDIFKKAFSMMKGYKVIVKPVPWKRGLRLMEEGSGFALYPPYYRPKLRPYMDYPVPVLEEGYYILCTREIAARNPKTWPDDYAGLRMGINAGFAIPDIDKARALNIKINEAGNNRMNLLKLILGRLDGYINDKNAILWELKRLRDRGEYDEKRDGILVVTTNISKEQGFMGFTNQDKGKYAFKQDFIKQFVTAINQMKKNGEIQAVIDSYIN